MKKKKYWYIANWKMNLSYHESITFIDTHKDALYRLSDEQSTIVICPTALALHPIQNRIDTSIIKLGAQDCSMFSKGNFTGQISAESLAQVGCTYAIVGHAEQRTYAQQTDSDIAQKMMQLLMQNITPIICIGEDAAAYKQQTTLERLDAQLSPIIKKITSTSFTHTPTVCIAYEPIWAIGTGKIPDLSHLEHIFTWLTTKTTAYQHSVAHWRLCYGGSVSHLTAQRIKQITSIDGFLIGSASTNFQEFEKIVQSS